MEPVAGCGGEERTSEVTMTVRPSGFALILKVSVPDFCVSMHALTSRRSSIVSWW